MTFVMRQYKEADHDRVLQLHVDGLRQHNASIGNPKLDEDIANITEAYLNNDGEFLVGERNGIIISMGAYRKVDPDTVEIKRIRIDAAHQRMGYGSRILSALETSAERRGYHKIVLDTTTRQIPAQQLFIKNGYLETRRKLFGEIIVIFYEKNLSHPIPGEVV